MSQATQMINQMKMFLAGKNSNEVYNNMLQNNPEFRKFVNDTKGKSIEDIALEYDIDLNILKQLL